MEFHGVDVKTQFKRMRELAPEVYRAFLEFDQKAFKDGAIPGKTKELIALGIAQITQCPWCIDAHAKRAVKAGASDTEVGDVTFVAMAMAAGAAWSHGGLAFQCVEEHRARAWTRCRRLRFVPERVRAHLERCSFPCRVDEKRIRFSQIPRRPAHPRARPCEAVRLEQGLARIREAIPDGTRVGDPTFVEEAHGAADFVDDLPLVLHARRAEPRIGRK